MRFFRKLIASMLLLSAVSACEKEIRFVGDYDGEKLVMYATANADSTLYANLFKSRFIMSDKNENLSEPISGATVTAVAGGRTITLHEGASMPGSYCSDYRPMPGETVTINASLPGFPSVSSTVTVPHKPDFKIEVTGKTLEDSSEGDDYGTVRIGLRLTIKDRPGAHDCYNAQILERSDSRLASGEYEWRKMNLYSNDVVFRTPDDTFEMIGDAADGTTYVCLEHSFDDQAFDGETHVFDLWFDVWVNRNKELYSSGGGLNDDEGDGPKIPLTARVDLGMFRFELDAISEDIYLFEKTLAAYNGGDMMEFFGEPVSIHNNISGGIGCFGAVVPSFIELDKAD